MGRPVLGSLAPRLASRRTRDWLLERVAADERLEVVICVPRHVRPDDGEPIGQAGEAGERLAEGQARDPGGELAGDASDPVGHAHLWVEGFWNWLGPPWRKRKMTDFPVSTPGICSARARRVGQVRQGQSTRPQWRPTRRSARTNVASNRVSRSKSVSMAGPQRLAVLGTEVKRRDNLEGSGMVSALPIQTDGTGTSHHPLMSGSFRGRRIWTANLVRVARRPVGRPTRPFYGRGTLPSCWIGWG